MKGDVRQKENLEEASSCRCVLAFVTDTKQVLGMSWQACNTLLEILSQGPAGVASGEGQNYGHLSLHVPLGVACC